MLARMFTQPANVLVFDEPTNDLDTETLELLEEILLDFKGAVLVVSHDREFLNNVVTQTLAFEGGGEVREYVGGYDDWLRQRNSAIPLSAVAPETKKLSVPTAVQGPKKLSFKENRELEFLPLQIEEHEKELELLHAQMADPAFYGKAGFIVSAKLRIAQIEEASHALYARWQELEQRPR